MMDYGRQVVLVHWFILHGRGGGIICQNQDFQNSKVIRMGNVKWCISSPRLGYQGLGFTVSVQANLRARLGHGRAVYYFRHIW